VLQGLRRVPKSLAPWLFYDAAGSALFERITHQPEYYLTRTEHQILTTHADAILAAAGDNLRVIELGAGSAAKTTVLLRALLQRQGGFVYYPIDISPTALDEASARLASSLPGVHVVPVVANNLDGLALLAQEPDRWMVVFLGSSIGNHAPAWAAALLQGVRQRVKPGDTLLLGGDMVKDPAVMEAAYNDAAGVTAEFNRNLLRRINRELHADFRPQHFRHVALWNDAASRVEMFLESQGAQDVQVEALGLQVHFDNGERLLTEHSHKFSAAAMQALLTRGRFALEHTWQDGDGWFGVHLARAR